jgi:putative addiction module killer protein
MNVIHYLTESGRDPLQLWLDRLPDLRARVAIVRRLDRLALGNPGDHKALRDGVHELRIDVGSGYRVYFSNVSDSVVLLLCGGVKRTQSADIDRAVRYLVSYKRRR